MKNAAVDEFDHQLWRLPVLSKCFPKTMLQQLVYISIDRTNQVSLLIMANTRLLITEAAVQRCSLEKVFWKYAAVLREDTHAELQF